MDSLPATDSQPDALPHRTASLLKRTLLFGSLQFVMLVTRARPPPGRRRARAPGAVVKPALLALCLAGCALPAERGEDEPAEWLQEFPLGRAEVFSQERDELQATLSVLQGEDETELVQTLEYGLTEALQVELELPWSREHEPDGEQGLRGFGVGTFYAPFSDLARGTLGFGLELGVPLHGEEPELEAFAVTARRFASCELHLMLGVALEDGDTSALYGLSAVGPGDGLHPLLEFVGEDDAARLSPGVVWQPAEGLQIALGLPVGVTSAAEDWGIVLRLTLER